MNFNSGSHKTSKVSRYILLMRRVLFMHLINTRHYMPMETVYSWLHQRWWLNDILDPNPFPKYNLNKFIFASISRRWSEEGEKYTLNPSVAYIYQSFPNWCYNSFWNEIVIHLQNCVSLNYCEWKYFVILTSVENYKPNKMFRQLLVKFYDPLTLLSYPLEVNKKRT